MNLETLKPIRTTERAKELGRKGGIASGKKRREQKRIKEIFQFADIDSLVNFAKILEALENDDGRRTKNEARKERNKL